MSDEKNTNFAAEKSAQTIIRLLKEYTQKINRLRIFERNPESPNTRGSVEKFELEKRARESLFLQMQPALDDLSRQASQYIQHGGVDPATRTELKLRLAEFDATNRAMHMYGL